MKNKFALDSPIGHADKQNHNVTFIYYYYVENVNQQANDQWTIYHFSHMFD